MPSSASASRHRRPSHDAAMDHHKSTNNGTVSNHHYHHYQQNPNTTTRSPDDAENRPPMMDDLMDLFTSTLQSLAADAACVREITSLAELTGVLSSSSATTSFSSFHRQSHGDKDNEERRRQRHRYYQQKLIDLDRLIAGMEQKVVAMRGIINEENQAISKFETSLQHEALQQDSIIQELLSLVMMGKGDDDDDDDNNDEGDTDESGVNTSNDGTYKHHHREVLKSRQQPAMSLNRSARKSSLDSQNSGRGSLSKRRFRATRSFDSADEQDVSGDDETVDQERPSEIVFEEVMESELLELKRNVPFGLRVSRYDLNDTMEQIQRVLERKMALEERSATHPEGLRTPSNSMQRRHDYLRQRKHGSYDAIETNAHSQHWWVTEQELREKCTFFRHGESSARGILSTLCSLRRLKQVPGKNREVTYLWL